MASIFDKITKLLMEDTFFINCVYRKRDSAIIEKKSYGVNMIKLDHWRNAESQLVVYPIYSVRFNLLSLWFEKFSFKSLRDQRDNGYIAFSGLMLGKDDKFYFNHDESNFEEEIEKLNSSIKCCSNIVFKTYSSLENAYEEEIRPILDHSIELPDIGADWFFENLTLCRIVHPENYERLKEIQLKHAKTMYNRGEPNIAAYYNKLPEILSYLESLEFKI